MGTGERELGHTRISSQFPVPSLPTDSAVNQPTVRRPRRFHDRLRKRRMRMDAPRDLRKATLEIARVHELLDQVGCLHPDDVRAEHLAVLLVADDLDLAA